MARPSRLTLLVSALAGSAHAAITPWSFLNRHAPRPGEACTSGATIPNLWSVSDLVVAYTEDETIRKGNASFTVTDTRSHRTQHLRCTLRFNYLCEFLGTPDDKGLHIWVQVNLLATAITFNQPWECDGGIKAQVTGTADVPLLCPEDGALQHGLSCRSGGEPNFTDGSVVLVDEPELPPAPASAPAPPTAPEVSPTLQGRGFVPPPPPPYPIPERDIKVREREALGSAAGIAMHNRLMGMARRGRTMAHALAHYDLRHREPEKIKDRLSDKEKEGGEAKSGKIEDKEKMEKKEDQEPPSEKKLIDELEHRLCSPSCLREATPGPESGRAWTNGRRQTNPVMPPGHGYIA